MKRFVFVLLFAILMISLADFTFGEEGSNDSDDENESDTKMRERIRERINDRENKIRYELKEADKRLEFRERIKEGDIELKIRGKGITIDELNESMKEIIVGKINARTGLNLSIDELRNGSIGQVMRAYMSNGRFAEVKIMPDTAAETALARLRAKCEENNCRIELKEVSSGNKTGIAYEVETEKDSRLFLLFKKKVRVMAEVDAESGEIIRVKKPWWSFLARERNASEAEIRAELNESNMAKITICHKPNKQAVTITVARPALKAHLKHGDTIGTCAGNATSPENNNTDTNQTILCPIISTLGANYSLNPCVVNINMTDGAGNVLFNTTITQEGNQSYGVSYVITSLWDAGFPFGSLELLTDSFDGTGNRVLEFSLNDTVLESNPENVTFYSGKLPILINGAPDSVLNLSINLNLYP